MAGKNINYFLMDGTPSGRIKCTISNWTGVAYRIPRTEIEKCKERDDLKQSGVYFLFGADEETCDSVVYVGQAGVRKNGEGILSRLQEHKRNPDKDYWTEAVVFTTSNNSFGPTEISWLENCFCTLAANAKRYTVKNGNDPNIGNVTEEKESELEGFVDYAKVVMGVLGHKIFEPLVETLPVKLGDDISATVKPKLHLKRTIKNLGITVEAFGKQTPEGFVVFQGSSISPSDDDTIPASIKQLRTKAKIVDNTLLENVLFNSPSYAAMYVIGKSANGLTSWKTEDGKTLKEIEMKETDTV